MKKVINAMLAATLVSAIGIPVVAQAQSNSSAIAESMVSPVSDTPSDTQAATFNLYSVETCFSLAQDILRNYYENIELGTALSAKRSFVDTKSLDASLSNYLQNKITTKQFVVDAANAQKENYTLKFNLLSSEVTKEGILLTISTEASFNYVGLDVQSGFGEVSNILFKNTDAGLIVTDLQMPYDYYDEYVRGQEDHSRDLASIYSKSNNASITERQAELHSRITQYFSVDRELPVQMNSIDGEKTTNRSITPYATLTALNKTSIATYAKNNKAKTSPSSGGSSVPYYDFSQLTGNWDCTNFVSHALLAGGAVPYDTNGSGIASTGWYYRSLSNRASSWSGVPNLYSFLVNNTTKGPAGTSTTYSTFRYNSNTGYPYAVGDILQFYLSGSYNNWRHSTIITEYYETTTDFVFGALVTGRSGQGTYNDNQKAEEIYPGDSKRVIKLTGYYK
ncbi:amidase domain-containing protein [Paenibacillus tepidiphilus]|uniref:amidase domain-containing protein n=1 Tax=Paenibacillus tepidiphilus TaxID=2608683 RepID=UPI00123B7B02|nr:amidase domain-containing protein [Paenibacillus tepidiphilus]